MQSLFFFVCFSNIFLDASKERNVSVIVSLSHLCFFFFVFSTLQFHHLCLGLVLLPGCSLVVTANHRVLARAMGGSNPRVSRADLTEGQYRA